MKNLLAVSPMRRNLPELSPEELGRPRFRRRNPLVTGTVYQFRQPLWDFYGVTVATALTEQDLFLIPIGQQYTPAGGAALTKSEWHTTMRQAAVLPHPQKFFTKSVKVSVRSDIELADAQAFLYEALVDFLISEFSFLKGHAWMFSQGGGPHGFSAGIINNGIPDPRAQWEAVGQLGEVIEQQQNIRLNLNPTRVTDAGAGGTHTTTTTAKGGFGINAFVFLDGVLSRSVQ